MSEDEFGQVDWTPQRKIVAAAVATLFVGGLQALGLDIPIGVEGAVAVLVGYFIPNKRD